MALRIAALEKEVIISEMSTKNTVLNLAEFTMKISGLESEKQEASMCISLK